ncbi:MAG: hypothetical protein RML95_08715 [Anaerolineae bacterium]|nr:hypothetical protein [Anaerolineae bacterium]MDW8299409.1 hypothetical protein [Anaerolineae bacterium]
MPRLRRTGIDDIADLLTQTPLGFMTSQAFLMVRPLFNGVRGIEVYDSLARLLSTPEGTEWLRAEIASLQEKGFGR